MKKNKTLSGISIDVINRQIKQKKKAESIVESVIQNPFIIKYMVEGLKTEKGSIKFSYGKILRLLSEKAPHLVYPYFDDFAVLLNSENNFIKWGAIITIANLTSIDEENKFAEVFEKYYLPVTETVMITASNIIKNSWKIALAKPELSDRIANEILKVQNAKYINHGKVSPECKNIVCGHAVESFSMFFDRIRNKKTLLDFIENQLKSTRPAVAKKAEKFLNRLNRLKSM